MVEILRSTQSAGDVEGIDIKNYFCFVDLTPPVSGQTGTLDRKLRSGSGVSYPLYHTCNRQQNKKKVTIVDSGGRDDESKV